MPDTKTNTKSSTEHWYAIYVGAGPAAQHQGSLRVQIKRDGGSRKITQEVMIRGIGPEGADYKAKSVLSLKRTGGRLVPVESSFKDNSHDCDVEFENGRLNASGDASSHDGEPYPDDIMPGYGLFALASTIFDQEESSISVTVLHEGSTEIGHSGAKLLATGPATNAPFGSTVPLWGVDWLGAEGNRVQSFYFDAEGTLVQADWGGSKARLVDSKEAAAPPRRTGRSGRSKKVTA